MTTTTEPTTTAPVPEVDPDQVEAALDQLFTLFTGGFLTNLVDIGTRTGLFLAAAEGPATSDQLAERAGLQERYVREWLGAMTTAGLFTLDPSSGTYTLPPGLAVCLTSGGTADVGPFARMATHLAHHVVGVTEAFRHGGGVPYEAFRPEFTEVMDQVGRSGFDDALVRVWLDLEPGVRDRLEAGARVADVGCGTGHAIVLLASAFPESTFVGYDLSEEAIDRARREASAVGVDNATFEVVDAATLTPPEPFDLVFVFDAIHDQADPEGALRRIHDLLADDGVFLMFEPAVSSHVADNLDHPLAPMLYAISTMHCLTVSLAEGGAGLGAAWGTELACELLAGAGFSDVQVREVPDEPINALFVARP